MATQQKFEGWVAEKSTKEQDLVWKEYEMKPFEETDIEIRITHCGVCGTDDHVSKNGWGNTSYPIVVGHEIVGVATRIGFKAEGDIKEGDIVGVGAQSDACFERDGPCEECAKGLYNYCSKNTATYGGKHWCGTPSTGGYARYHRCPSRFVVKIPKGVAPEHAAPMLCAGGTMYAPLKHYKTEGRRVAIIGIGGLGHFGIMFARALGAAEVVAISRGADKKDDALALGADGHIATGEEGWATKNAKRFDLIINTADGANMPWDEYLGLLKVDGTLVSVGAPEKAIPINIFSLLPFRRSFSSASIATPDELRDMLQLAADKNLKPWVETRPMREANETLKDLQAGKPRFRYVLVNED
ncbi:nadp-dependent alcohol dehydrogenase [Fusarium longipes]|uniref:Nadp-dependent alcohol dehydrogenase n=1 Tax=Fusarium longipes TaxID=694270 RepID=A0A395SYQ3_9HYPO|nr:nadp-dependent alcohol dehydrogenase [Fusarium longipes]